MTHRVRAAFGRLFGSGLVAALALLVAASSLAAQATTGKVEGTVTDQQGAPITNAQVSIVGTSFGSLTDNKGYYFFNNVPVGTYTLRARFIGYTPAEVHGVRVLGGYTLTQNFKLSQSAVAVGPVTVEVAANPIVPRDQVTSSSIVHDVSKLPVNDVRDVVSLQPGVVESGAGGGLVLQGQLSPVDPTNGVGGIGWDTVPTFIVGGIDTVVNVVGSDGSVNPVALPRFVQYGGQCPTGSDATNPTHDAILHNYGFECQG